MANAHAAGIPPHGGTVHRTISLLDQALRLFGLDPDPAHIERMGVLVNRAMSSQQRSFHTPEHIFDLADPSDPHLTLAAVFHDVVYFQVDDGFSTEVGELLLPFVSVDHSVVRIRTDIPEHARSFHGCAAIFGFAPGDVLHPFGGLNEFLSALVMDVLLEGIVSDEDLLIATASIEATIPFRRNNNAGMSPPEQLAERLAATDKAFGLGLGAGKLEDTVKAAVRFSNRDVHNFAEHDVARFLDNTWKLLPETNPELRFQGVYSIRNYAVALHKMHGFLRHLDADAVFHEYRGEPSQAERDELLERTTRNLKTSSRYLGIKLASAGVLDAIAQLTGGDAPVALFMGDIQEDASTAQLADYLPDDPVIGARHEDATDDVFRLLAHGRAGDSRFDLKNSPLSLFVYRCLTDAQIDAAIDAAASMFAGQSGAEQFLGAIPEHTVVAIATAIGKLAFTREPAIAALLVRLAGSR